jgi:ComF family protein
MGIGLHQSRGWQRRAETLLGLFLTGACPLCERSTAQAICPACERQVRQSRIADPLDPSHPGLPVLSWGRYEDSLRQAIRHLKYSGHPELAGWLGLELGKTWQQQQRTKPAKAPRPFVLVPIPLHASKLKQRGFNQAERLAQGMGRTVQVPVVGAGLVRVQATQAQHSLGRAARQANLAQAFQANPSHLQALRQKTVWLVDDIFTTGATAHAAAHTLRQSGISVAGICTVARAERLDHP